ncbi:conserved hypothetical protein [Ferrimonas balearica DSM 9799]|uniref:Lipoprotein n=1 Tax=Ferrimonas balearica (strain DSM 9799 / CCM 4581 / KCTC 23876 / PAT) TaxID=550540 RepID=E1SLV6_FERBD|nr:DUF3299 domain-containing protein [Ferrimonas balearica]ADN75488.1 conserved hypothetical protein [Ferrimonas balearica DSM 9799]
MKNIVILALSLLFSTQVMADVRVLEWDDLRPESERNQPLMPANPHAGMPFGPEEELMGGGDPWVQSTGPVVPELNGETIRLPGFIVPLEGDETKVTEFLLVPYFGACVHVPPPPTNQLVYVKYKEGIPLDIIWDAIWVTGKLNTNSFSVEEFSAGYTLEATLATPYDEG